MTFQHAPEYVAPDDVRCEALVKGQPSYTFEWMRHDHQCPRQSNQMRGTHQVCWQHARMKHPSYMEKDE